MSIQMEQSIFQISILFLLMLILASACSISGGPTPPAVAPTRLEPTPVPTLAPAITAALQPTVTPGVGLINGKVTQDNGSSNQGIGGAQVQVFDIPNISTKTENDGRYTLANVPVGQHFVVATTQLGTSDLQRVNVSSNPLTLDIRLPLGGGGPGGDFHGRVLAADGGPARGAIVWVLGDVPRTMSDANGNFQLTIPVLDRQIRNRKATFIALKDDRWGFTEIGDENMPVNIRLDHNAPAPQPPEQRYDFVARAPDAKWTNNGGTNLWNLPENDAHGSVSLHERRELEDGSKPVRVLETRPQQVNRGSVSGLYPQVFQPTDSDYFFARVGFLKGADNGNVNFTVTFIPDGGSPIELPGVSHNYQGNLDTIARLFPQQVLGKRGRISLTVSVSTVEAAQFSQNWAVWVDAQIVRAR